MGQSAPRTLLLLLAGLLGEALAGFPNTISIGKRPPRHGDPLLPPPAAGKLCGGGPPAGPGASAAPAPSRCCGRAAEAVAGPGRAWRAAASGAGRLRCPFACGRAGGFAPRSGGNRARERRIPRSTYRERGTARTGNGAPRARGRASRGAAGTPRKRGVFPGRARSPAARLKPRVCRAARVLSG